MTSAAETAAFLGGTRLFDKVDQSALTALAARMREQTLRNGQVLFRQGAEGHEMFIVRRGSVVISKPVTGNVEQILARYGPGDFFGEMSLFDRSPRSASVQAETESMLLVLDRESLGRLTQDDPRAAAAFFHALVLILIERLRASGELVAEITRWGLEATGLDVDAR